ncbi:MAG: TonB-dependent receptor [Ignavibacteriales bacterium]|nr:TonB-dependent receptor [Ignavibacteriales bacterium]
MRMKTFPEAVLRIDKVVIASVFCEVPFYGIPHVERNPKSGTISSLIFLRTMGLLRRPFRTSRNDNGLRFLRKPLIIFSLFVISVVVAQEKPTPEKPQPEPKRADVSAPTTDVKQPSVMGKNQNSQTLPKIDLPEFVITGIASIDLPSVEKEAADERTENSELGLDRTVGARDRGTVEFLLEEKQGFGVLKYPIFSGRILASMGNYFTPKLGLLLSQANPEYQYLGDVQYHLTKGYAPYTNSSGGSIGAKGSMLVHSSSALLDNAILSGNGGYGTEIYRFYGSPTPSLARTTSSILVGAGISGSASSPVDYDLSFRFKNFVVTDSSTNTTQNRFDIGLESRFQVWNAPLVSKIQFYTASLSQTQSSTLSYLELSIGNSPVWWNKLFLQASANLYVSQGMQNQQLTRVYPHVSIGYQLFKQTTLLASYRGSVNFATLDSHIEQYPYLSANAILLYPDIPVDVTGALETNWSEHVRTRLSYHYQEIEGYNLLTDVASPGIWSFFYGGKTTVATFQTDLFAQVYPNSYFAVVLAVNSTKNSVTQDRVPYKSDFELSASYSYTFPFGLRIEPRANFVDRRNVDVFNSAKLPDYLLLSVRGEYAVMMPLSIVLDLHNILDRKYELWRGYQAPPFMIAFGLTYKW